MTDSKPAAAAGSKKQAPKKLSLKDSLLLEELFKGAPTAAPRKKPAPKQPPTRPKKKSAGV